MQSTTDATADLLAELKRADEAFERARTRVEEAGESTLKELASYRSEFTKLLARYRERATGTGDFLAYVEFEEEVSELVGGLPDDLPERDAFEAAEEALDKRRLSESDFDRADELLSPVDDLVDRLDQRREALNRYQSARRAVVSEHRTLEQEVKNLERVRELGNADLDAPVERLRDPIEAYDDAVKEAFETFTSEASTRAVLELIAKTRWYPLVEYLQPPADLKAYVDSNEAGTEPIYRLLEYAEYSRSKLSHYVDDEMALKRAVATQQTYLQRLDAEPLTVGWPPPEAGALELWTREYESIVRRFAPEPVIERLRAVRRLPAITEYDRLRDAAVALDELSENERNMIAQGIVEETLTERRARRDELSDALSEHPER